jgi:hypothetical protein
MKSTEYDKIPMVGVTRHMCEKPLVLQMIYILRNLAELHSFRLGRFQTQGNFLVGWIYQLDGSTVYWLCSA